MSALNWTEKESVLNHQHHVPIHLLKDTSELATGDPVGDCFG
jgi:hypothetical protein